MQLQPLLKKGNVVSHCQQQQSLTVVGMFARKQLYKSSSPKAADITEKIAKFFMKGLRPYIMVNSSVFRDLVNAFDPRYNVPSRKQFSEVIIPMLYNTAKENILNALSSATQVP